MWKLPWSCWSSQIHQKHAHIYRQESESVVLAESQGSAVSWWEQVQPTREDSLSWWAVSSLGWTRKCTWVQWLLKRKRRKDTSESGNCIPVLLAKHSWKYSKSLFIVVVLRPVRNKLWLLKRQREPPPWLQFGFCIMFIMYCSFPLHNSAHIFQNVAEFTMHKSIFKVEVFS